MTREFTICSYFIFYMKDTAPGPDGIPYSVYGKFWTMAGPLVLKAWQLNPEPCYLYNASSGIQTQDLTVCLYLNLKHGELDQLATMAGFRRHLINTTNSTTGQVRTI